MKTTRLKIIAAQILLVASMTTGSAMAAGSATLTLSPSSGQATQGSSYVVSVYENGNDVNVVTVRLNYDASKLSCDSGSVSSSAAFPNSVTVSCGGGQAVISRYTSAGSTAPSGSLVANVTFNVVGDSGAATVSVADGSQIASNGANVWDGVKGSVSVSLSAAPVVTTSNVSASAAAPSTDPVAANPVTAAPVVQSTETTDTTAQPQATNEIATSPEAVTVSSQEGARVTPTAAPTNVSGGSRSTLLKVLAVIIVISGVIYLLRNKIAYLFKGHSAPAKGASTSSAAASVATTAVAVKVPQKKKPVRSNKKSSPKKKA